MRLSDGVQTYVDGKRLGAATYAKGIKSLSAFYRHAGDVELSSIRERQVASFLDGPHTSPVTWRQKYNLLVSVRL
jgi:integrase/recombinase XerD